jgi:phosphoribosylformimino-5-aminoimidazole carboxamide ribotide isomerase
MTGPNTELYADCVARFPTLRVQASGGVRDHSDLEALRAAGATAAIIGRALLEGRITDEELRTFLPAA